MNRFSVLIPLLFVISGCNPETQEQKDEIDYRATKNVDRLLSQLRDMEGSRIEPQERELIIAKDRLNGVTCWSVGYGKNSTLSCLPD